MMLKIKVEGTERHGHPASCGRLEAETCRVDQGDNGHGHAAVWQVDAADTSLVLDKHAQEVIVCDFLTVRGSLNASHHELVFRGDLFHLALLFLLTCDFILDVAKIEGHLVSPVSNSCVWSINGLVDESVSVNMTVVADSHGQYLLHIKTDSLRLELAVLVIHAHLTHGDFVGQELVLLEHA